MFENGRNVHEAVEVTCQEEIAASPEFEAVDNDRWRYVRITQPHSAAMAERWARLMQKGMAEGRAIGEALPSALILANYGRALQLQALEAARDLLYREWHYGNLLYAWYNPRPN